MYVHCTKNIHVHELISLIMLDIAYYCINNDAYVITSPITHILSHQ